ncbi:MAG: MFS transporter [Pseudonocardia sp.]|nr:MFS transporter [Pseudonocardia sp.]
MSSAPIAARTGPNPWYVAVIAGMASYLDAATIVSSGNALVIYQKPLGISGDQIGVLSFSLTLGIAIGAATGGRLGDRFGRKPVFSVTMIGIAVAMACNTFATGFPLLLAGAILAGLCTGADLPVSIATIAEAGNDSNRGKLVSFSQVLWTMGIIVPLALTATIGHLGRLGGQIIFGSVGIIAIVVLVARITLPESPVWLAARDERRRGVHTERAEHVRIADLLKKPYAVPFICLLVFYPLVNLAANTGGQFGTYLWVNTAGSTVEFAAQFGLIQIGVGLVLALLFLRLVDTRLRMPVFYVGAACYVLSALIPTLVGVTVPTLMMWQILAAIGGAFAFEAILKVWTQESFPTLLRSTAQGTIISVARVLAALLALVTPRLAAAGPRGLFAVLTVLIAIGMAAAIFGFRHGTRNEFDIESDEVDETGFAHRHLAD